MIVDVKKTALSGTTYFLKSVDDHADEGKWTPLKRSMEKAGKPFRVLRKVFD